MDTRVHFQHSVRLQGNNKASSVPASHVLPHLNTVNIIYNNTTREVIVICYSYGSQYTSIQIQVTVGTSHLGHCGPRYIWELLCLWEVVGVFRSHWYIQEGIATSEGTSMSRGIQEATYHY